MKYRFVKSVHKVGWQKEPVVINNVKDFLWVFADTKPITERYMASR